MGRICSRLLSSLQEVNLFPSSLWPSIHAVHCILPELSSIASCLLVLRAAFVQFGASITQSLATLGWGKLWGYLRLVCLDTACSCVIRSHTSGPVWLFTDLRLPVVYLRMGIPERSPGSRVLRPLHRHPPASPLTRSSTPLWTTTHLTFSLIILSGCSMYTGPIFPNALKKIFFWPEMINNHNRHTQ